MIGIGAQELLLILIVFAIAVGLGKVITYRLREDQRKIVGGVALFIGAILVIYGISTAESAFRSAILGILVGVTGLVVIATKGSSGPVCSECAERLKSNDKFCPNCGTKIE